MALPPLPPLPPVTRTRDELVGLFRGPTDKSNWVVPGQVLCGDRSSLDSAEDLGAILEAGVTTIVCLQSREEVKRAVDYMPRALAIREGSRYVGQFIPDQMVTGDDLVEELIAQLLERLRSGEVLYVHCKGGHGRTGTVCSVLLGRLYGLGAPEAMARTQLFHDTRRQPTFCMNGYQETADGSSCKILFPCQREQVLRLLPAAPPPRELERALSAEYGAGASVHSQESLERWKALAEAAAAALSEGRARPAGPGAEGGEEALRRAVDLFRQAAGLRPEFARVHFGLAQALRLLGDLGEARVALSRGLEYAPEDAALLKENKLLERAVEKQTSLEGGGDAGDPPEEQAEPQEPAPALEWRPKVKKAAVVMLVGLPGSGKSSFAEQLVASGGGWTRVCQDELSGNRSEFEKGVVQIAKDTHKRLILDRTNVKTADRKSFLDLASRRKPAVCVFFDHPRQVCEERVAKRTDHPTIRYGGGQSAVRSMQNDLEAPTTDEGFEEVIVLRSFRESDHLLACWGAKPPEARPMGFFKFPTTPHVLDLTHGSALQESDRLLALSDAEQFFDGKNVLIVEEKIDGANLGISLTENYEPLFQNRAKYVTSKYATQWKALDEWWREHSGEVCQLLKPEVEVLFGEWTWQRHSVEYTKLPAYFVAFDIYNKSEGRFVSARERDQRLRALGDEPGIPAVPRLAERAFSSRAELEALLGLQSAYSDGPLEGIYLRMDEPEEQGGGLWNRQRGKIVRADFIQGIEDGGHFINKEVVRNKLA